jgi:predicted transposase YdaD
MQTSFAAHHLSILYNNRTYMPNDYDKIIKENFDELLPHMLKVVFGLDVPNLLNLKDKLQITIEREMDHLKMVVHEDPAKNYGLHWEVQSTDEDMRRRNLLYYGLFYERYQLPLRQYVIYIGDQPAKKILNNSLHFESLTYNFEVVALKTISKDLFLQSDKPEVVILAILADFGKDKPEKVIKQILEHLLKIVGRVPSLKKCHQQLLVLARLRKLEVITKAEIILMPIHYEIETDGLYLEGIEIGVEKGIGIGIEKGMEKGMEKGIEKGIEKTNTEAVTRMLRQQKFTLADIMLIQNVSESFVRKIAQDLGIEVI